MAERPRSARYALAALALGLALAALTAFGSAAAALGALLAQPALALAASWYRGTRALPASPAALRKDTLDLLLLWGGGFALSAVLLAWPLSALRESGSLPAALGVSAMAGIVLIALWRTWPMWYGLERDGGSLAAHRQALAERDAAAWHGLGVATLVALAIGLGGALAWPGLMPADAHLGLAGLYAALLPVLHWALQRVPHARVVPARVPVTPLETFEPSVAPAVPAPDAPDEDHDAALLEAARAGRVERALQLLEAGADPHAQPPESQRDQRSLPTLAAVLPDLRLLRALIARGIDLNHAHAGMTPLLAATRDSWHGRPDAVTTLLANGADPRAADAEGSTPLHHAARSSDPGVAALLLDAAAEIDALNREGLTPLGVACVAGNWRLAKFLLERGAKATREHGQPVLLAAAGTEEDDPVGVQLLLKHRAKVDSRDGRGRSALHQAARAGHADIIGVLLAAGADVHARDDAGRTPLLDAARGGSLPAVEALVEAGSVVTAVDGRQRNALVLTCSAEWVSPALVRRLLELGVDPAQPGADGRRAVEFAAEAGRWAIVSALDPSYPLPSAVASGQDDLAPPDRAPIGLVRDGLQADDCAGLEAVAALCPPAELGGLLHDPAIAASPRRLEWLLMHGAVAEARNAAGDIPLFVQLARGPEALPVLAVLLQRGLSPAGAGGLARFMAACVQRDPAADTHVPSLETLALDLLERGADPFGASRTGDRPLSLAVRLGWPRLMERLLDLGVDRESRDSQGMSALHLATALGREGLLKRLIAHGACPHARAADGQTPLGVALASGRRDLAYWLDWRGWALPKRALRASDLPAAAMAGDADAVRRLLDLGFPVDAPDTQGCTGLLRAAGGGHRATVDLLVSRGADPQHAADTGATPLSAAVSMRQTEIVHDLLACGAQIEHRLPGGVTVLMLAAALGLPDIVARLLTAGADVHASDGQGLTPLHCAALFGFIACDKPRLVALFDTLLLAGAEPERVAAGSVTPLLLLLGARAEPGTACDEDVVLAALERLLEEGVSLEVQDPRGFGPLHLAALHGLLRVVRRLLRAGADPDLRDALNRTPREIAVMRGFIDVAAEFAPVLSGASMARFLRESR
ncbi:MAG TPA: ankyrin repeat domain-containing protein [Pseudoxanthomonas sp.]|nr:ankyrin repeat domain-containing protein [Pseudoxanthomonas sp.]